MFRLNTRLPAVKAAALATALATAPVALVALSTTPGGAAPASKEITITVLSVRALDRVDDFSNGDLYARVTIDGETIKTPHIKGGVNVKPDWKISKKVAGGTYKVKFEILDKDLTVDDPVDVNRLPSKRDLDFEVNTKTCKVTGFASTYSCGATIKRAGDETKKAEVAFKVSVK